MANGQSRSQLWASYDHDTQLSLVIAELDKADTRYEVLAASTTDRLAKIEKRLAWILGIFVAILVSILGNLALLSLTR